MKRIFLRCSLLLFCIPAWGYINQNNDVQLWIAESVSKNISPTCSLALSNEWRIGDDISKLYFFYLQGTAEFKPSRYCYLVPGYRQIWDLREAIWRLAFEPFLQVTFRTNELFQFRNRISYIVREATFNVWQYRARFLLSGDWQVGTRTCKPYISNEIFVRSRFGFDQNRLIAGILVPLFGRFEGDFYYMLRFLKSNDHWTHQHVIGTWLSIKF